MTPHQEFEKHWTDYLEGELDDAGMDALKKLLESDPDLQERAADYLQTHRLLGFIADDHELGRELFVKDTMASLPKSDESFVASVMGRRRRTERRSGAGRFTRRLAAAAAALVLLGVGFLFVKPDAHPTVVRVESLHGKIHWTGNGGRVIDDIKPDTELGGGTFECFTSDGWLELVFPDETRVTLSGQSMLTLSDFGQKELRIRRGAFSIKARKQPPGKPILVFTPSAKAEILGTQLNIVAEPLSTRIAVNEGRVRVTRVADGQTEDVTADHYVVAALEQHTAFKAVPRQKSVDAWRDSLPKGITYGKWDPPAEGRAGSVRATPMLHREPDKPDKPMLLYVAALKLSVDDQPPTVIRDGARLRVRGRLRSDHAVVFGFTATHARGGFAGKYLVYRDIKAGDRFEVVIPLADFKRKREQFPESSVGLEVYDFWMVSLHKDVGLSIEHVALDNGTQKSGG
ncbi:MAG: FecR family protein [Verrucomicrobiota bacterium]